MAENYEPKKYTEKNKLFDSIIERIFANKQFKVTAEKIQHTLLDIVESLWQIAKNKKKAVYDFTAFPYATYNTSTEYYECNYSDFFKGAYTFEDLEIDFDEFEGKEFKCYIGQPTAYRDTPEIIDFVGNKIERIIEDSANSKLLIKTNSVIPSGYEDVVGPMSFYFVFENKKENIDIVSSIEKKRGVSEYRQYVYDINIPSDVESIDIIQRYMGNGNGVALPTIFGINCNNGEFDESKELDINYQQYPYNNNKILMLNSSGNSNYSMFAITPKRWGGGGSDNRLDDWAIGANPSRSYINYLYSYQYDYFCDHEVISLGMRFYINIVRIRLAYYSNEWYCVR